MAGHSPDRALRKTALLLIVFLVIIGGGAAGALIIRDAGSFARSLSDIQQTAQQVSVDLSALRFDALKDDFKVGSQAARALDHALSESLYFQLPFEGVREQLRVGHEISIQIQRAFDSLILIAIRLDAIADHILESDGSPRVRSMSDNDRKAVLEQLSALYPELVGARASLALTRERLMIVRDDVASAQARIALDILTQKIEKVENAVNEVLPIIEFIPPFLASGTEKTYLILMQNNTEVRPTGGFIGTYGVVTIRDGSVVRLKTDNVYNLDDSSKISIEPPRSLAEYGPVARWYLRDSNWSPDFAQSARQAMAFYRSEGGHESLDGVISLTPDVIASLMRIVGPVSVEDLNFHPEQFIDELEYQVEKGYERRGIEKKDRKDVIGLIANDLFSKVSSLSVYDWRKVGALLDARRSDKHIMMYFPDRAVQQSARGLGLSGEVLGFNADYLMVVDANILSLKTDRVMEKNIDYTLAEQKDGSLLGTVALTYKNNGTFSWTTTTYRDYVRILIPNESKLLGVNGAQNPPHLAKKDARVDVSSEHGKLVIGAYFEVEPQKMHTITFQYRLPQSLAQSIKKDRLYQLFVQKQSGVDVQQLTVHALFQRPIVKVIPVGFLDSRTSPSGVELRANLQTDKHYNIYVNDAENRN